ncbi:MAG TPA: alanine--tRNA ligase, partial [bacterium]|nr:alanine--tRNA ligase [bacterium]
MTSIQIRERFLKFFESLRHKRVASASLIPVDDPTLYFTNAGMVPFKNYFTGAQKAPFPRATSSQKCLRVSGKHNDLENVGRTARHHTFFEMLGNFSFGDYFKREAIRYAWDFLTLEMKIPKERLWITVYEKDDEAEELWQKEVGVPKDRIKRLGEKDNFWAMGDTGPCGPCSEIHYDHGKEFGCGKPDCAPGCDSLPLRAVASGVSREATCDRFMEIWNLVFMQFDRDEDGHMKPLPKPSIDTGMGLERLACVAQGVHSNYDSDLFTPLIRKSEELTGKKYGVDEETDVSIRVLCDHIRSAAFLIADGVQPSNEGRGYVLRRVLRRAIRHGRLLGMNEPFFYKLADVVLTEMGSVYAELGREIDLIKRVVRSEEEKFLETLDKGLAIIREELEKARKAKERVLSGGVVFKLYDTYGFPIDLTELIAQEASLDIDMAGFEELMEEQKGRGRRAWKGSAASKMKDVYLEIGQEIAQKSLRSEFVGYDHLKDKSPVAAMIRVADEQRVEKAGPGEEVEIVTLKTPFYPEGGGQVGDHGTIETKHLKAQVLDTHKGADLIVHRVKILEGRVQEGDEADLAVDPRWREGSMTHHSATHLLHAALRRVLGTHVRQAGSLVTPEKLRFDFSHFEPVSKERLVEIEEMVNDQIRRNLGVTTSVMSYDDAIKAGALAFFGDKYGDRVRVCQMGDFSTELCGGTHVAATGQIGLLKITGEGSVAAGIRRVEAVVGVQASHYLKKLESEIDRLAAVLKANPHDVVDRVEKLLDQVKRLEKDLQKARTTMTRGAEGGGEQEEIKDVNGVKVLTSIVAIDDPKLLRDLSDQKIQKLGSGIAALGAANGDKVTL